MTQPDSMIARPSAAAVVIRCLIASIGELLVGSMRLTYAANNETQRVRCDTKCNRTDVGFDGAASPKSIRGGRRLRRHETRLESTDALGMWQAGSLHRIATQMSVARAVSC